MERAEYYGESELRYKPVNLTIADYEWLEFIKTCNKIYSELTSIPQLTVTVYCHECNMVYETIFSPKVTCPICKTTNDCIIDGKPTEEWKLRHS